MRRAALLLAALSPGCSGPQPAAPPDPAIAACEAATAFAEQEIGRRGTELVFADEPGSMGIPPGPARDFDRFAFYDPAGGKKISPPPAALMAALHAIESKSALSGCPSLRAMLDARHIGHGPRAVARAKDKDWPVISLSMPAAGESEAVLAKSSASGPLYSDGDLYYLRRDAGGKWRVIGISPLWIT
ncbi:MAG: hypothetical protein V4574_09870 [Pseudomonadota bacterium]